MPKTEIDYSNTIIYKITCKDTTIKDVYVGHTTNFVQRKHSHKQCCINAKSSNYKCKLYETIRNTGGWTNWTMEIINFFNCRDHYAARKKEQEYFVLLNATLNSIEPLPKPKEFIPKNTFIEEIATANIDKAKIKPKHMKKIICEKCNIECLKTDWASHILSDGHKQQTNAFKNAKQYNCESCNFICSKQSNYNTHLLTSKHKMIIDGNSYDAIKIYKCICGCTYKYSSGYCRHKKSCTYINSPTTVEPMHVESNESETNWVEIIQMLIKENQEIRNAMITQTNTMVEQHKALTEQNKTLTELVKNQQPSNNTNSHNTNSHNNNYNITMFLADKCKDAQNMSEFIEIVKSKVDMMQIYEHGYVNGISKLFIDELKSMEVTERPLHCTDERRNTFYVHNNDAWNKDEDLKDTKKAISHVSQTNLQQCVDWSKNVPDGDAEREDHITKSINICKQACSGDDKNNEKIIKNISKEIPLNKQVISDILI